MITTAEATSDHGRGHPRRGVLLLIVLSMLTLFMMLGTAYLVVATRAKETARAFSRMAMQSDARRVQPADMLDRVMLTVVAGGTNVALRWPGDTFASGSANYPPNPVGSGTGAFPFESLLADKYGVGKTTIALRKVGGGSNDVVVSTTLTGTAFPAALASGNTTACVAAIANVPLLEIPDFRTYELVLGGPGSPQAPDATAWQDLPGRVITLLGAGRAATSHRIVKAVYTGQHPQTKEYRYALVVDNTSRARPFVAPANAATTPLPAVINGREFAGNPNVAADLHEAWDGFDDRNPFLARVEPQSTDNMNGKGTPAVAGSVVFKPSYVLAASGSTAQSALDAGGTWLPTQISSFGVSPAADNDNDGINDGFFLDFGLPRTTDADGNTIRLDASVLVVDLDGRFNVNAHGSLMELTYSGSHAYWPNPPANAQPTQLNRMGTPKQAIPMGLGVGPAEINPRALFDVAAAKNGNGYGKNRTQPNEDPALQLLTGINWTLLKTNGVGGQRPGNSGSRYSANAPTPRLPNCEGRYGQPPKQGGALDPTLAFSTQGQIADQTPGQGGMLSFPFARSGQPFTDDTISRVNDRKVDAATMQSSPKTSYGIPPLWWDGDPNFDWKPDPAGQKPAYRGVYNSPPDLHGRMKFTTGTANAKANDATRSVVPGLIFTKAEWIARDSSQNPVAYDVETTDDPYEIPLASRAPRNGWLSNTGTSITSANPFSTAELEKLLRPYDLDAARLPSRLEAMLGSLSEEARLRLTTASWDTTAITGEAARRIVGWFAAFADSGQIGGTGTLVTQLLGGEAARGERFDLNRALSGIQPDGYQAGNAYYVQRQVWCKDLFVILVALDPGADDATRERYAQWVANACDFRDGDSTMTPFEVDIRPENGWDVDGDAMSVEPASATRRLVWGAERPEIVISEVSAWEDDQNQAELFVMLHRPWNARAYGIDDASIAAEPCDVELDAFANGKPTNRIELAKKSEKAAVDPTDASVKPVWRLRIVDNATKQTTYARLDVGSSAMGLGSNEVGVTGFTTPAASPKLDADGWLLLQGTNTQNNTITATGTVTLKDFKVPGTVGQVGTNRDATIYLERLTDPTATVTGQSWQDDPEAILPKDQTVPCYRVVDKVEVTVVNRSTGGGLIPPPPQQKKSRLAAGPTAFWRNQAGDFAPGVGTTLTFRPLDPVGSGSNAPTWFHWPNRPFISATELIFVPGDRIHDKGPWQMLDSYRRLNAQASDLPSLLLLDAVHVPTRFAGIHTSVPLATTATNLWSQAGIGTVTTPVNQLSAFREPGRVNLNTVTADDVWDAVVAGPLVTKANGNQTPAPAPLKKRVMTQGSQAGEVADFASGQPARSMAQLLALDKNPNLDPTLPDTQGNAAKRPTPATDDYKNQEPGLKESIDLNPVHGLYTATRLANTATTRSHLFGVWITLRSMVEGNPDSVRTHRAFYVIDRSIPVAFEPGKPHNVRDAVVLRRIIE
ncbi:MAG: hypothetical protein KGQ61_06085 [Planctomycetes bacterium]|nr:hypothetical protein [Planctomycetota bacterium]